MSESELAGVRLSLSHKVVRGHYTCRPRALVAYCMTVKKRVHQGRPSLASFCFRGMFLLYHYSTLPPASKNRQPCNHLDRKGYSGRRKIGETVHEGRRRVGGRHGPRFSTTNRPRAMEPPCTRTDDGLSYGNLEIAIGLGDSDTTGCESAKKHGCLFLQRPDLTILSRAGGSTSVPNRHGGWSYAHLKNILPISPTHSQFSRSYLLAYTCNDSRVVGTRWVHGGQQNTKRA